MNFKPGHFPPKGWVYNPTRRYLLDAKSKKPYEEAGKKIRFDRQGQRLPDQVARKTTPRRLATPEPEEEPVHTPKKSRKQATPKKKASSSRTPVYHRPKPKTRKDEDGNILPPSEQRPLASGQGMFACNLNAVWTALRQSLFLFVSFVL